MLRMLMILHHNTLCTPCITVMLVAHTCTFAIDHVEQGRVEPPELAPVETADYKQDQGKPQCI
jgi:hypothetical protein